MYISEQNKERILAASEGRLLEVVGDYVSLHRAGASYVGQCPHCKAERGLNVNPAKGIFKCFKCNEVKGNSPLAYLMSGEGKTFPEALEVLARKFGIDLEDEAKPSARSRKATGTYCQHMLKESGLTAKDVQATVFVADTNRTATVSPVFRPGTVNDRGEIVKGDDVIIEYYDLDGAPVTYEKRNKYTKTVTTETFFRVRFKYPHEHLDKDGKPAKYKSPYGSTNQLYIPEAVRRLYRQRTPLPRLFIQEGEKKAEKASKHGIPSVGISGINNLGQNGQLPPDLVRIIEALEVKEVVLLFDSDWNRLSDHIKLSDSVDKRPRNFFYAARNFRDYIRTLKNRDIYVEIYVGHVKEWETGGRTDKGIDDLLANTLKGHEEELARDIDQLVNRKDLEGQYIRLWRVTSWTDSKLEELWALNNPAAFARMHKQALFGLPEFKIGRHKWRFKGDGDEIESAQPIEPDEQYWEEQERTTRSGETRKVYEFNYVRCFRFLQNRGFGRYKMLDDSDVFIHMSQHEVRQVKHTDIRDFISEFTAMVANEDVLNMLYRGGPQYLGPDKLSNLKYSQPNFEKPRRDLQRFYFEKTCWDITADGIREFDYTAVSYQIWADQKQAFQPALLRYPLIDVRRDGDAFSYRLSSAGRKCHFLQFLINTSDFTWRKRRLMEEAPDKVDGSELDREESENVQHLVSKLAAIGYMLMTCKDRSVAKAVIAMDGKQSEVGQSNGRSGKSIIGEMFKQILPTAFINGKNRDMENDTFLWDAVTEKTRVVFIDDVRTNFDIEFMFPNITGDWNVNHKGGSRAVIPFQLSPKVYIPTNHALNGKGSSFTDRMWIIAFSDYYNDTHKPVDDFGQMFFDEWDFEQWNLFWNLLAVCVQVYLRFGVVEAPAERIELRNLRQQMGENFLLWAEEYFSDTGHLNTRIPRSVLGEDYKRQMDNPKFYSSTKFKEQIKCYCRWKGYTFNPQRLDAATGAPLFYDKSGNPVLDDKSGGVEYFTIGTPKDKKEDKQFKF